MSDSLSQTSPATGQGNKKRIDWLEYRDSRIFVLSRHAHSVVERERPAHHAEGRDDSLRVAHGFLPRYFASRYCLLPGKEQNAIGY